MLERTPLRRSNLPKQIEDYLRHQIDEGIWQDSLPSERFLCDHLKVSRGTLRLAIERLREEGVVETKQGRATRVAGSRRRPTLKETPRSDSVGVIAAVAMENLTPSLSMVLDELRSLLHDEGLSLHVHSNQKFFYANNKRVMAELFAQNHHRCWILAQPNRAILHWFRDHSARVVCLGYLYEGIELPSVSVDLRATGFHAASRMVALGHRKLAFLAPQPDSPGVQAAIEGFTQVRRYPENPDIQLSTLRDDRPDTICSAMNSLLRRKAPFTALFVPRPMPYLTVATFLQSKGYRIGKDLSLVGTYGDPFFNYIRPTPAHYRYDVRENARKMLSIVKAMPLAARARKSKVRIMPEFIMGDSLGPPPS